MWTKFCKKMLNNIFHKGTVIIKYTDGSTQKLGDGTGESFEITMHDPKLPMKLIKNPDLAMGEAYMDGKITISNDDLYGFLKLVTQNIQERSNDNKKIVLMQKSIENIQLTLRALFRPNTAKRAQKNVEHHYDLSDQLYDAFLDKDKQYSCGYFKTPDDTLEQAQEQKKQHIAKKLQIKESMRVLDIGCGWGGMSLTLARDYGASVVGVTLSKEQHKIATQRAKDQGLNADFRLMDYRHLDEKFDRIVSVGMFEHVGILHYREYFQYVRNLLSDDGVALIHTIGHYDPPKNISKWFDKYIFPGSYLPAMSEVLKVIENEYLRTADVEIWRTHYAETLRHWRLRFKKNLDKMQNLYDDRFCRMWNYYLIMCEINFRYHNLVVFQFQICKNQDTLPYTRDYMYS